MSSQSPFLPDADLDEQEVIDGVDSELDVSIKPPVDSGKHFKGISLFWHDRLVEAGLILSMALYYIIGNANLGSGYLFQLNPLFSAPFLLLFALLCWYRLPFAIALLPLTLPYYLLHKTIVSHYSFSLAEITLGVCLLVALLQLLMWRSRWQYWLPWQELRTRLGPFTIPILVFLAAAAFSIIIAYDKVVALRSFREEVFDPLLYVVLALYCLRSRQHLARLLAALLGSGFLVALLGIVQFFFFKNQLVLESDGIRRVHVMYGSANSIGLLFDYVLPIGLALVVARRQHAQKVLASWKKRALAVAICLPLLYVLYLTQSIGAWLAIAAAALFIAALSIRSRRELLTGVALFVVVMGVAVFFFHTRMERFIFDSHVDVQGVSTATKRLYLWQSALNMIHDSPWFGYGMDNWLCHYSYNTTCFTPHLHHYLIANDPVTGKSTDLKLEPFLSHPHNVFLHVWVSIGIFGLLAFAGLLVLFFWLFVRILKHLHSMGTKKNLSLQWMTIGVGAAMLAAMLQGLVDSAFLEQDLAFCFWMLVVALLLLRTLSGTPWRGRLKQLS
ncbi:MAG: O-antigen ligase family protein [Ktedonobacteraceae bacterium]